MEGSLVSKNLTLVSNQEDCLMQDSPTRKIFLTKIQYGI